jgi:hypothetical protein
VKNVGPIYMNSETEIRGTLPFPLYHVANIDIVNQGGLEVQFLNNLLDGKNLRHHLLNHKGPLQRAILNPPIPLIKTPKNENRLQKNDRR